MIVATTSGFDKRQYRKFNIKNVDIGDDFIMLKEVLIRRMQGLNQKNYPDLIMIDGGRGHLAVAKKVLKDHKIKDIPVIAIAKGKKRNAGDETFFMIGDKPGPIKLSNNKKALYYLQKLRDEAHRFAISTYRSKHIKSLKTSGLDGIPGIGDVRKKVLLNYFGSFAQLTKASINDIIKINGISKNLAKTIYSYLHIDNR